jgi:acyl-CoA reductase-like NAD-dependent aldehyde dehydrogenase
VPPDRIRDLADGVTVAGGRDDRTTIAVEAPFTGDRLGEVPACSTRDLAAAVHRAREAGTSWADRPTAERAATVRSFRDSLLEHRAELLDLV